MIQYFKKNALTKYQNRNKKWKAAYQEFIKEITEKTGLAENDYKDDIEKIKADIKPYPTYFTDIFGIMVDTEINRNPETEKQVRQWRKTNSERLKEIAGKVGN